MTLKNEKVCKTIFNLKLLGTSVFTQSCIEKVTESYQTTLVSIRIIEATAHSPATSIICNWPRWTALAWPFLAELHQNVAHTHTNKQTCAVLQRFPFHGRQPLFCVAIEVQRMTRWSKRGWQGKRGLTVHEWINKMAKVTLKAYSIQFNWKWLCGSLAAAATTTTATVVETEEGEAAEKLQQEQQYFSFVTCRRRVLAATTCK